MFRTLNNFLSYLQKNANGAPIFGNTSNMNTTNQEINLLPIDEKNTVISDVIVNKNDGANNVTEIKPLIVSNSEFIDVDIGNDDSKDPTFLLTDENNFEKCNVISVELDDNSDNEIHREEFPAGELLLLNENLNSTSHTLDPITDPLAIEDDFQNDIVNSVNLPKPSSISDIVSTDGNILYIIDIDNIKEQGIKIDELNSANKSLITTQTSLQNSVVSVEEQELRSDGSDSGLGSETSVLQITSNTNNTVQLELPIPITTPSYSNLKRRSENETGLFEKRPKRSINFEGVKIYYFPRIQGFACVPSQGGCTLGMGARHIHLKTFTLAEHAAEQRRTHKLQMQEINPRGSSSEESDSEDELSEGSSSDLDADANGFLQPVPAKQRRALLKAAGVRKIDPLEKDECRAIRSSREFCGCNCRGYCDPDSCSCSQAGIKCQVDRPNFPCGCTRDGCANIIGRVEFNPGRVRTHFIHTIMRLDLENKQSKTDNIYPGSLHNSNSMLYGNNNCEPNKLCRTVYNSSNENIRVQSYDQISHTSYNQNYMNINNNHSNVVAPTSTSCYFDHQQSTVDPRNNNDTNRTFNNQQNLYGFQMNTNDNTHMLDYTTGNNQLHYYNDTTSSYFMSNNSYQNQNYANYQLNYNQTFINAPSQNNCAEINEIDKNIKKDNETTPYKYTNLNSLSGNTIQIDAINDLLHNNRNTPPVKSIKNTSTNLETAYNISGNDPVLLKPNTAVSCTLSLSATNTHISSPIIEEETSKSISTYTGIDITEVDFTTINSKHSNIEKNIDEGKIFCKNDDGQSEIWVEKRKEVELKSIPTNHISKKHGTSNELNFSLKNDENKEKDENYEKNNPNYYDESDSLNKDLKSGNCKSFPSENENKLSDMKDEIETAFA